MSWKEVCLYCGICILLCLLFNNYFFKLDGLGLILFNVVIIFFSLFTLALIYFSKITRQSKELNLFTRIFLISVFLKIVFFVFIILYAVRKLHINKKDIIIPSLIVYLIFTIYETYALMKLSKVKQLN